MRELGDLLLLLESIVSRLETGAGHKFLCCSELDKALDKARRGGTRCWVIGDREVRQPLVCWRALRCSRAFSPLQLHQIWVDLLAWMS